jgi:HAD superfamily hydrolase (TIGR01509 family)
MENNGKELKAVIFDVDGTLVDSNDHHAKAWQEAFKKFGIQVSFEAAHQQIGKGGDQLMPEFLTQDQLERLGEDLEKYRGDLFKEKYLDTVQPFPRVRELLEKLKENGLLIALASSAKEDEVEKHQKTLGIEKLVDFATSKDDSATSKPAPDIFNAALKGLDVDASEAIVVGDSPWDIVAARKARLQIICLLSGGFSEEQLRDGGAAEIYDDVSDLLDNLERSVLRVGRPAVLSAR